MKLFGICYVVFGLMAVIGTVLDADGVMEAIRRLPTRWMDRICQKMSEFIMEHRPGLLIKIDYTPQVDTVPRDRLYQVNTSHRCLNPAPFCWVSGYQWWQEKNY